MDKNYWEEYYKNASFESKPSSFAVFLQENYNPSGSLIELGCGNGRDSMFFGKNDISVLGIDQCSSATNKLNSLNATNCQFLPRDFTNLDLDQKFNTIYSRFTLHSVDEASSIRTINWASKTLLKDGLFAIEVRSANDELFGVGKEIEKDTWFTDDHARRFVRIDEIKKTLLENGFSISYEKESKGLAVYKDKDPTIIRLVCTK